MSLTIGFGRAALGKRFRLYSVATIVSFVVFGALTGIDAPGIAKNLPTPWIGVWERINIEQQQTSNQVLRTRLANNRLQRAVLTRRPLTGRTTGTR